MNEISLQLPGLDARFGFGGSSHVDGHRGSGSDASWGCQNGQSANGTEANQQQAMSDIMKAAQTHDPERRAQLLRQALATLQGNGGSDPTADAAGNPTGDPTGNPTGDPTGNSTGNSTGNPMGNPAADPTAGSTPSAENTAMATPMPTSASDPSACGPTSCGPTDPTACGATDASGGCNTPSGGGLTQSGNSVNTGEYTIDASTQDDGSLTITNNETHQSTEIWGDPHVRVNGQNTADFQKDNLNIQLQDGTVVHIQPTATNSQGVSHIGQVSITKGNQAVTMGGTGSNGFADGVNTSGVTNDGHYQSALYNTPTASDVTLGADGNLYYNNANGSMGGEIAPGASGSPTDLDGAGGGLAGDPSQAASSQGTQQLEQQLMAMLSQQQESFYSMMAMQELQQMQSRQA